MLIVFCAHSGINSSFGSLLRNARGYFRQVYKHLGTVLYQHCAALDYRSFQFLCMKIHGFQLNNLKVILQCLLFNAIGI